MPQNIFTVSLIVKNILSHSFLNENILTNKDFYREGYKLREKRIYRNIILNYYSLKYIHEGALNIYILQPFTYDIHIKKFNEYYKKVHYYRNKYGFNANQNLHPVEYIKSLINNIINFYDEYDSFMKNL